MFAALTPTYCIVAIRRAIRRVVVYNMLAVCFGDRPEHLPGVTKGGLRPRTSSTTAGHIGVGCRKIGLRVKCHQTNGLCKFPGLIIWRSVEVYVCVAVDSRTR